MRNFLDGVLGLAILILVAGVVTPPLVGSDKAFDPAPAISFLMRVIGAADKAVDYRGSGPNPKPIGEVAASTAQKLATEAQTAMAKSPVGNKGPDGKADPRMATCAVGSVVRVQEKSDLLLENFRAQPPLKDLIQVQEQLGEPACIQVKSGVTTWLYLGTKGKVVKVIQDPKKPTLTVRWTQ